MKANQIEDLWEEKERLSQLVLQIHSDLHAAVKTGSKVIKEKGQLARLNVFQPWAHESIKKISQAIGIQPQDSYKDNEEFKSPLIGMVNQYLEIYDSIKQERL